MSECPPQLTYPAGAYPASPQRHHRTPSRASSCPCTKPRAHLTWLVLSMLLSASLSFGCSRSKTDLSAAKTTEAGRPATAAVATSDRPRIVSLSPALTEVLFAVGCGDTLVARDGWSDFPPAAQRAPKLKGLVPPVEAVVAARPSMVLSNFPPARLRTGLDAAGVKWLGLAPKRLEAVAATFPLVGRACGREAAAKTLATAWRDAVEEIRKTRDKTKTPRVFLELDPGGGRPHTVGKGTFLDDVIDAAGGRNVMADAGRWVQVSTEQVLAATPDIILITAQPKAAAAAVANLKARPGWKHLPAVKNGRVFAVNPDLLSRPGPRLLLGLRAVAAHLTDTAMPALRPQLRAAIAPTATP